jgi:sirohydrochlorin ferrochelatase
VTLVLVAHGTREPAGAVAAAEIVDAVRARIPEVPVELAFADVQDPGVPEVLRRLESVDDRPVVVVPAFLAAGYHVRVDVPEQIARSGRPGVLLSEPIGPAPSVVAAVHERLVEAGWRRGDAVVLAAAGSSDERALADVRCAATALSERTRQPVRIGYVTTARPSVDEAVAAMRRGRRRVAVASWLLAPGLFHRWVAEAGADLVSDPIGAHPRLVEQVVRCYADALAVGGGGQPGRCSVSAVGVALDQSGPLSE